MKTIFATTLLVTILAGPLTAQAPARLTLLAAIDSALKRHPALELAGANANRAQSGVREARSARLPSLSLDANGTRFEDPMLVAPIHALDLTNPPQFDRTLLQGSVSLSYALFDGARGARVDRARALADVAATGEGAARMQVIAEVVRAYLRLRAARETLAAHESMSFALLRESERVTQLVEQGRAARVVLLRAQAAAMSAQAELAVARSARDAAARDLARQIGVAPADLGELSPSATRIPAVAQEPESGMQPLGTAPELVQLEQRVRAAEAAHNEARALRLPRVLAGGRFIEYAAADASAQGEWQAGVQLSYPLITGGSRQAAIDRAGAEVRAARAELELGAWRVDEGVRAAWSAYVAARERMNAFAAAVTQAEEITRIDKLALAEGAGVQSDYFRAEADLLRARAGLTEARAQAVLALVEIARLTGRLSESWVAENVEPQS